MNKAIKPYCGENNERMSINVRTTNPTVCPTVAVLCSLLLWCINEAEHVCVKSSSSCQNQSVSDKMINF